VNNSHKDITAFNISIKEPTQMGMLKTRTLEEFLGKIIA